MTFLQPYRLAVNGATRTDLFRFYCKFRRGKFYAPFTISPLTSANKKQNEKQPNAMNEKASKTYLEKLTALYFGAEEFLTRKMDCGKQVTAVSLETMCSDDKINQYVVKPLLCFGRADSLKLIEKKLSFGVAVRKEPNFFAAVNDFTNGYTLIFLEDEDGCIAVDTRIDKGRTVAEPPTSIVMHGPREGFVEDLKVNMTLLRKRLKTPAFKTVTLSVGKYTNTAVAVCYLEGVADKSLVDRIAQRVSAIRTDGILDSSYLARYLDPNRTFLFHRVGNTEKPDIAVGKLLEGRVVLVVDGSPMVLTLPYLYIEDIQSPGDYYDNSVVTSVSRILRFISILASVLLPSIYVCLQMYNYQIIPLKFLITILNSTESIPFSPLMEMLLVLIVFDILREANLRMPTAVGISLSLVGAIVLGDAAVKAGLFGAPAVMIGALSGIGLFTMPDNTLILSLLRLAITFIGGTMGLLGVILAMLTIIVYLVSLENYRTPFLAPYAPDVQNDRQDAVLQKSLVKMKKRPRSVPNENKTRRGE